MADPFGHAIDDALTNPAIELDRLRMLREHAAAAIAAQASLKSALTRLDREIKRREKQVGDTGMRRDRYTTSIGAAPATRRLPRRLPTDEDMTAHRPVQVVWELTLACNLRCVHCGSRAGRKREGELSTEECLDVVRQLAELGTRQITLIGGEAYLRKDWLIIAKAITDAGIHCGIHSGARALTEERIRAAVEAGIGTLGVSIDGPRDIHDRQRGVKGSFDHALRALRFATRPGSSPA